MKMKKMENFQNKMGCMGCKWSSLNAPGIKIHLSHPIMELGEFHYCIPINFESSNIPPLIYVRRYYSLWRIGLVTPRQGEIHIHVHVIVAQSLRRLTPLPKNRAHDEARHRHGPYIGSRDGNDPPAAAGCSKRGARTRTETVSLAIVQLQVYSPYLIARIVSRPPLLTAGAALLFTLYLSLSEMILTTSVFFILVKFHLSYNTLQLIRAAKRV